MLLHLNKYFKNPTFYIEYDKECDIFYIKLSKMSRFS